MTVGVVTKAVIARPWAEVARVTMPALSFALRLLAYAWAAPRIKASRIPVDVVVGTVESMPLPDGEFDTAVSVLTMCSV